MISLREFIANLILSIKSNLLEIVLEIAVNLSSLGTNKKFNTSMNNSLNNSINLYTKKFSLNGFNHENKGQREVENREMMLIGILSIKNGDSTRVLEEKLKSFLN